MSRLSNTIFGLFILLVAIPLTMRAQSNNAVTLDGTDDYIECGSDASIDNIWTGGGTAMAWVNTTSDGGSGSGRILAKRTSQHGWNMVTSNDDGSNAFLVFQSQTPGGVDLDYQTTNRIIPLGEWVHIAITYDKDDHLNLPTVYINGEIVTGSDVSSTPTTAMGDDGAAPFRIGRMDYLTGRAFHGEVDEVSLWTRTLSQTEIKDRMCRSLVPGDETGLAGYWPIDEGVDNTCSGGEDVCDISGNGNHGVLTQ